MFTFLKDDVRKRICGFMVVLAGTIVILQMNKISLFVNTVQQTFDNITATSSPGDFCNGNIVTHTKNTTTNRFSYPCAEINMPTWDNKTGYWKPVQKTSYAFTFSAYFIHESKKVVIIGIRRQKKPTKYFCQFWCKADQNKYVVSHQTPAKQTKLPEDHGFQYAGFLFECPIQTISDTPPMYVSLVDKNCTAPLNIMLVQHVTKPEKANRQFTVCLSPLHGKMNIYRLVEWIEFNKILGAQKFFIYTYVNNTNLNKALKFYSKNGLITVIHWNLPVESGKKAEVRKPVNIHYFGQVAALNDCLYRNKYESEFIVNVDYDEFIIPHTEKDITWDQMLSHVKQNESTYIVRNVFFDIKFDNTNIEISNKALVEKYKLITLTKMQREDKIYAPEDRSKYFARTSRVQSVHIHTVSGKDKFDIPQSICLLHHYRQSKTRGKITKVLDRTVPNKFGDVLIKKVKTIWSELNRTLSGNRR